VRSNGQANALCSSVRLPLYRWVNVEAATTLLTVASYNPLDVSRYLHSKGIVHRDLKVRWVYCPYVICLLAPVSLLSFQFLLRLLLVGELFVFGAWSGLGA
jgi:serine/threonine protein kinase